MLNKIIEVERERNSTALCEICFATSQNANLYRLNLGFENNGTKNQKSKIICNKCLQELKEKLKEIY